jgi:peptidoglycan/LPS O-acetylase OafA/YrhL
MTDHQGASLKYRPDIDGLRAVAVLSVVCYHIGLPVHGGFVGVDIFFTISGFLIGSIILRETAERRFTFARFYERRIRRIIPALLAMLLVSTVLGVYFLLPAELVDFAKSMASATFSVSNIYFWGQTGYFDGLANTKPLLHTWSLAVEEQFYVLLPILLVLLRRFLPRRVDLVIYVLASLSFLVSVYGAFRFPSAAFFWMHTRAWELLIGTMLALKSCPQIRRPVLRNVAAGAGLLMICAALILYSSGTTFPGLAALPPCLGAALIIAAGRSGRNLVGRLLSLKPVTFIGLISYSLYLWHWPLIVYKEFGFTILRGLGHRQTELELFAVSIIMATLSWRFVEVPFRTGALRMRGRRLMINAGVTLVITALLSIGLVVSHGLEFRFAPRARDIAAYNGKDPHDNRDQYRNGICFITSGTATLSDFPLATCLPDNSKRKNILVFGDSHAAALWWGMDQVYEGVNVMQATASGCKPVLHQRPRQLASCTAIVDYILKDYLPTHKVDAVLIEAHWDPEDLASLG